MLTWIALAWLLGILLAGAMPPLASLVLGVVALGSASLIAVGSDTLGSRLWAAPLAALAFCAGLAVPAAARAPLLARGPTCLDGVVEAETARRERRDIVIRVLEGGVCERARTEGSEAVTVPPGTRLRVLDVKVRVGARVRIAGEVVPSVGPRNPSPHPPWPDARPIAGVIPARDDRSVQRLAIGWFDDALGHARESTRDALRSTLSDRVAGVAAALVLGDGAMLDETDAEDIRGAGLSHVLAVSGTHIAIVGGAFVMAVERVLRRARRVLEPHRWAAAAGIPFAILHALFAGAVPSGLRAAATSSLAWGLVAAGRRPDALETTALATLVLGVMAPLDATRPGFLLSVIATMAVLTSPKPADDSLVESLRAAWLLAVRCGLATAPLVIYVFGDVPLASLVANLVLVPMGSVALLPLSLLHTVLALLSPSLAAPSAAVFEPCARAFLAGSAAFAAFDDGVMLPPPTVVQALVLVAAVGMAMAWPRRPSVRIVLLLLGIYGFEEARVRYSHRLFPRLEMSTLDIGQGDSHLLRMPDGRVVLVDAGPSRPDVGERVIAPLLRAMRIDRIDIAVLTHRHPDHYGGLGSVAAAVPISELWEPGDAPGEPSDGEAARLLRTLERRGTRVRRARELCGRTVVAGSARIALLSPCPERAEGTSENDASLVLRIDHGSRSFLLVGDAEREAEARLLAHARAQLRVDVLKIGHHGSRTSTTAEFVSAVHPRYAVVSAGPGNRFGHPHPETLATLRSAGVRLLRTDTMGAIRIVSDGTRLVVEPTVR